MIGDYIGSFKQGDLFIIGQNLPHVFKSDKSFYEQSENICHSTTIFLIPNFISSNFFELEELNNLKAFIDNSKKGRWLNTKNNTKLVAIFHKVQSKNGSIEIINLLLLIKKLSLNKKTKILSHIDYKSFSKKSDGQFLNTIFQYTLNNYKENITLDVTAKMANRSPASFCRFFFKQRTHKTYISFLNEVLIQEGCSLLLKQDFNISEICFQT